MCDFQEVALRHVLTEHSIDPLFYSLLGGT